MAHSRQKTAPEAGSVVEDILNADAEAGGGIEGAPAQRHACLQARAHLRAHANNKERNAAMVSVVADFR